MPSPRRLGRLAFLDNEQALAGSYQMTLGESSSPAANVDGMVASTPAESGILTTREHALKMASFGFFGAQDLAYRND